MELDSLFWNQIKTTIKTKNGANKLLENWLDPIELIKSEKTADSLKITFGVPSQFFFFYVNEHLKDKIAQELREQSNIPVEIDFVVTGKTASDYNTSLQDVMQNTEQVFQQPVQVVPAGPRPVENINEEFTFSTFVVGKNSEFAHAATYNVACNPGTNDYNPLLIYGPSGMGKTHLLNAAGNQIRQNYPHLRIVYISAERFLNECVSALRRHEMDKFRQKYRENTDVIVVDDVQYIGRGEAVQEEFFHMINSFIEKKKQVVLASDRMPKDILGLEDRSRTRLERGLIADITMPDLETRLAILRYKAENYNVRLNEDTIQYIAKISKKSIRELEGNLKKIKMFSELQGLSINLELARKVLAHHENTVTISIEEIQRIVAEYYKIRVTDLKSTSRAKPIVVPRQIAMYLIKKFLDKSLVDIGKAFGGKDHTTVINSLDKVENLQNQDPQFKNDIDELINQIHNVTGL
ncbi:chromosomal replication initiator protein DnaA [Pseudobdellovibrio exovorus]|uniref:Chromosomal replication initiator protein DnaA n=1 Tax=Pseudobdellovibrio exovorus JSS TaxID=1184267 RepID=M4V897_9BACT|nr:chromosomal replication initiator protein DnaA [Pseudobdellovibrio exovorus]AGH94221.1 chromosomal replication initiator protein dnaA [Pseudobdellovibrio exovorus JSS]